MDFRTTIGAILIFLSVAVALISPARSSDVIKIGATASLTGPLSPVGRQVHASWKMWQEQINSRGGVNGKKVELIVYDDQSSGANLPPLYTKLFDVDKVDVVTPNITQHVGPMMPLAMERNKLVVSTLALNVNEKFKYDKYFHVFPNGPTGNAALAAGFFEVVAQMQPRPRSIAVVYTDTEYGVNSAESARLFIKELGLKTVYDRSFPPNAVDFLSIFRSVQATQPDVIFVASQPGETVNLIRAVSDVGLKARIFGGAISGLQNGPARAILGDKINGIVGYEVFLRAPTLEFPGTQKFIESWRAIAAKEKLDELGFYLAPLAYAQMQVIEQAFEATKSTDSEVLGAYLHKNTLKTILGDINFGPIGEWTETRLFTTQFQNVKGSDLKQYDDPSVEVILLPERFKTGILREPFSAMK